jgi:hypothetical protein
VFTVVRIKKSNCVKEVEKIKQRRAERRAAQILMREQHELEFDVSVPSWEFEAMIRCVVVCVDRLHCCMLFIWLRNVELCALCFSLTVSS